MPRELNEPDPQPWRVDKDNSIWRDATPRRKEGLVDRRWNDTSIHAATVAIAGPEGADIARFIVDACNAAEAKVDGPITQ